MCSCHARLDGRWLSSAPLITVPAGKTLPNPQFSHVVPHRIPLRFSWPTTRAPTLNIANIRQYLSLPPPTHVPKPPQSLPSTSSTNLLQPTPPCHLLTGHPVPQRNPSHVPQHAPVTADWLGMLLIFFYSQWDIRHLYNYWFIHKLIYFNPLGTKTFQIPTKNMHNRLHVLISLVRDSEVP